MWTKCLKSTSSEAEPEIKNLVQMILQEEKKKKLVKVLGNIIRM